MGILASLYANAHSEKKKYEPSDFMPDFLHTEQERKQERIIKQLMMFAAANKKK